MSDNPATQAAAIVPLGVDPATVDEFIVWSSAGKDSQTALRAAYLALREAGAEGRMRVGYNALGDRVSWPSTRDAGHVTAFGDRPSTRDLAEMQAARYGLPFEVWSRSGPDLLDDIEERGKFPDAARRWCTSDHKRGPGRRMLTARVRSLDLGRPARIVQVYGFRAEESRARAGKQPFAFNASASNGRRQVWDWYPIHGWTEQQVWKDIQDSGVPYHWAYDGGMSRLSCSFCVLASKADLLTACRLRPDVAAQYAAVEQRIGHQFQQGRPITGVLAEAHEQTRIQPPSTANGGTHRHG
jgi:3'-phosphoadenosine 5'-phosphosulfate sulfotransferase (PAPS reductase)/FAD synthetase